MEPVVVAGRYQIVERLGSGGMGTVYLATDTKTGAQVALKILHAQFSDQRKYVNRFEAEAVLACKLRHPNVCAGLERGLDGATPFFTMEVLSGRSLAQLVSEDKCTFDPDGALKIIGEAAAGLSALVSLSGVIAHRDLSSANIFLDASGRVKIADFGIAKLETGNETGTGSFLGNVNYMSPEQINDPKRVDVRSDIYTLGIVLYEMLSGHRPFDGSPTEIANKQLYGQVPPLHLQGPHADIAQEVLSKTLAKDPTQRFQSPQELAAFVSATIPSVQLIVPKKRATAGLGRIAAIAGGVAAILLLAVVLSAFNTGRPNKGEIIIIEPTGTLLPIAADLGMSVTTLPGPATEPLHLSISLTKIDKRARIVFISVPSITGVSQGPSTPKALNASTPIAIDVSGAFDGSYTFIVQLFESTTDFQAKQPLQSAEYVVNVRGRKRQTSSGTSGSGGLSISVPSRNNSVSFPH